MINSITLKQFTPALLAYQQIRAEIGAVPAASLPDSLPPHSILFGIAGDGLPLLLRLDQPATGPVLILGDKGSGKTAFLQTLAQTTRRLYPVEETALLVLTDFPDEWQLPNLPGRALRVYPAYQPAASNLLLRLADWANARREGRSILLLLDGLDSVLHLEDSAQQALAFLLEQGPQLKLWPIVSINSTRATKLPEWLEFFRTRIYGRITNPQVGDELTHLPGAPLEALFPAAEFCLRQRSRWMRFWLPNLG
jgi:hypothetical protein